MSTIGFHASHEQIAPDQLLRDVQLAEHAGFTAAMCSDHIAPWSYDQGHSGHAWSWLGAALATTNLPIGVVTSAGYRYHPAVLAQASATLAVMFPDRFWLALGSGENLNEHVAGHKWPPKAERQDNLEQCFRILRRLYAGERVTESVGFTSLHDARIWEQPETSPPLILPALTPGTAQRFAAIADGIITVNRPREELRQICDAYRAHGGVGPLILQVHLSWAETQERAEQIAYSQWRTNTFSPEVMADLRTPGDLEARADKQRNLRGQLADSVQISADLSRHAHWLNEYFELGFDQLYLHHVGQDQTPFIETFGQEVLPQLR